MAKVFLRVYNREIESMIEGGQLDEAVAHCQHILKTFPMYIDTYRLLGKSFLEARRYADAADIFQRVLMAVPDDFVSHVGMSIIRDDENALDDAIWHMERAFEVQPSNSAIQGELRRLYGRRDGVEPSKIRLSRDALANMYSQGELFDQAIAEIRSVLAEDTNRPDLQVMLARAYYRSGQKVEAAEMATTLLKKYPYCMDALRVLVDVLPGTSRPENTQAYRQRLHMLDPYSSFAVNSVFASDQVVDSAVNLERLDYRSGSTPVSSQPDWASSLGIKLNDEKQAETPPEWMQTADTPGQSAAYLAESSDSEAAPAAGAIEGVPDWMRTAGWQESPDATQDGSIDSGETQPEAPIAKADIPDWLKSMAPAEVSDDSPEADEPAETLPVGGDGIPEWLKPTGSPDTAGDAQIEAQNPVESQPVSGEDVPDWFTSVAAEASDAPGVESNDEAQQPVESQPTPDKSQSMDENATPDWLKPAVQKEDTENSQMEPEIPVTPQVTSEENIPDWLKGMASAEAAGEAPAEAQHPVEPSQASVVPDQPAGSDDVPDWLEPAAPTEPVGEVHGEAQQPIETQQEPVEPQSVGSDDVPDWLESAAPTGPVEEVHGEAQQPIETQQEPVEPQSVGSDDVPEWLKSMAPLETVSDTLNKPQNMAAESQPVEEDVIPDWLKSSVRPEVSEDASVEPQMPVEPQAASDDGMPDWLKAMVPAEAPAVSTVVPEPVLAPAEPSTVVTESGPTPPDTQPVNVEISPDSLAGVRSRAEAASLSAKAVEQSVTGEPPVSDISVPQELPGQTPVRPIEPAKDTSGESFQPTGEVKPLNIGDDALGWLESLAAKQGAKPEELLTNPQMRSAEMPDWLRQTGEEPVDASGTPAQEHPDTSPETVPPEPLTGLDAAQFSKPVHTIDEVFPAKQEAPLSEHPEEAPTQPVDQPVGDEDDTMAWLEELAANQGIKPEEPLASPKDDLGTTPGWIQEVQDDQPVVPAQEEEPAAMSEPATKESDITITSWLNKVDVEEALRKKSEEATIEAQPAAPAEELPDWLKDLEKPAAPVEVPKADDNLPDWLRQPIPPLELEPVPPIPGLDSAPEPGPGTPAWIDENVPVAGPTAPTMPGEWLPADEKAVAIPDSLPAAETPLVEIKPEADSLPAAEILQSVDTAPEPEPAPAVEAAPIITPMPIEETLPVIEPVSAAAPASFSVRPTVSMPTLKQTGMLSHVPVQDKDAELLSSAQDVLDQNSLDDAMKKYSKLIKKGRLLDEVIHDLREAIYRYPVDVIVWQTLGDAYMRANRLQDALDAYTKAEELLR